MKNQGRRGALTGNARCLTTGPVAPLECSLATRYKAAMSLHKLVRCSLWSMLFLAALAVCLWLLPPCPLMTVVPPEGAAFLSFSADGALLLADAHIGTIEGLADKWYRIFPDGSVVPK
jgi:hypothetical protein